MTKKTTGPKAKPWQGAEMLSVYTWFGLKCGTYTRPTITWQANKLKKNKINSRTQVNDISIISVREARMAKKKGRKKPNS